MTTTTNPAELEAVRGALRGVYDPEPASTSSRSDSSTTSARAVTGIDAADPAVVFGKIVSRT